MSRARRWTVLVTVSIGLLLISLDNSILYTALPTLTRDLGASGLESLWIINAYPLVMVGLLLGIGTLGDRLGHRRMYLVGLVVFGIASAGAAFAPNAAALIGARAVLAVGAAFMMPATLALIRITFRVERERNIAIAIWGSIAVVGMSLGPILGGTLLEFFWWGSVFLINVPVVAVTIVLVLAIAPRDLPDPTKRWDAISSTQVMVGLVGAVFAIKEAAHAQPSWLIVGVAVIASALGFWLFVRRQRRLEHPLLVFSIFRNAAFSSGVIAAAVALFAIAGIQLVTTQRFQLVQGFSPLEAGLLVAALAVGTVPTSLLGGAFLHRTGLRLLIAGGFAVTVVGGIIAIASLPSLGDTAGDAPDPGGAVATTPGFGLFVAGLLVIGLGLGAVFAVASSAIIGNAPTSRAGMAAGVEEVSYEFGGLIAVALLGSLVTFVYTATVQLPDGTPEVARESLSDALAVAGGDPAVVARAGAAYDTAFAVVLVVIVAVLLAATVATAWMLRRYGPGTRSQLHSEH
ncbi:MFS transporter [Pseudoclavibacter endophyticus]|uniref:MFS transporter n=1 Tax=Pseudoclavibacter endophyticus TaxID=1778590 RepID=A0A6H9WFQ9_9MICO|nr:MFS transporter [Pseudoclavibacter endophyticus]KAB1646968.1 MFS transporter [Pseudoclavibacter endophyticus]